MRRRRVSPLAAVASALVVLAAVPGPVPAADSVGTTATRPAADAEIVRLLADLDSDAADARTLAQLRLKNLPGSAYEAVRARATPTDLSPAARAALAGPLRVLAARHARAARAGLNLAWYGRSTAAAHEAHADPAAGWAAAARAAVASLADEQTPEERLARFAAAYDTGCRESVVVVHYFTALMDARLGAVRPPVGTDPRAAPRVPAYKLDVGPNAGDHLRAAVAAADQGGYPAHHRCLAHQALARFVLNRQAGPGEARAHLDAALAAACEAVGAAGCPDGVRLWVARSQADLERRFDSAARREAANREPAVRRLADAYAAAADPAATGPLLFKAEALTRVLRDADGRRWADAKAPDWAPKLLAEARAAAEAGWQRDGRDGDLAAAMVDLLTFRGDVADAVDAWFGRAMAADPDNVRACELKAAYLSPDRQDGGEAARAFGVECLRTGNFRGGVAMMPVSIHARLARDPVRGRGYYDRPGVWEVVRDAYEGCLSALPADGPARSAYAKLAYTAGRYAEARDQLALLGDAADPAVWGGRRGYDLFRLEVVKRSAPGWQPVVEPSPVGEAMRRVLAAAAEEPYPSSETLRPVAGEFPLLRVGTEPGKAAWNKPTLNRAGLGVDCLRFRTPARPMDLRWSFVHRPGLGGSWYIVPVADQHGVRLLNYSYLPSEEFPNAPVPGEGGPHNTYVQAAAAANFEPDTEYLIWFRIPTADPVPMSVAVTFVPPADRPASFETIVRDLGLTRPRR